MDPISQGVFGATAAQVSTSKPRHLGWAALIGWLSGMAPDLDVVFRSSHDPLFALEYHRQFTHSLAFIPLGSLICALVFYWLLTSKRQISFGRTYLWCLFGYATHGLLDACTTYGTQLLWPFSTMRVAWNTVSIIDPLLTIPLLVLIGLSILRRKRAYAIIALVWIVVYSSLGIVQRERAEAIGQMLAKSRGHEPVRLEAKPSFGNILLWKIIYEAKDIFYVDAVGLALVPVVHEGASVPKLDVRSDFAWLDPTSQQAIDIERFRWFSNDYLAMSPHDDSLIIDMRYSAVPNQIRGLWGIKLDATADDSAHVTWVVNRSSSARRFKQLWAMIVSSF